MIDPVRKLSKQDADGLVEKVKCKRASKACEKTGGNVIPLCFPDTQLEKEFEEFRGRVKELLGKQMPERMRCRCIEYAEEQVEALINIVHDAKTKYNKGEREWKKLN